MAAQAVTITGADGFLGRAVLGLARARGVETRALGRGWDMLRDPLPINRGDVLLHLAARTDVEASWKHPEAYFETNTAGAARVFRLAHEAGAAIVYLNTCPYSGENVSPIAEDGRFFDRSPYHMSKRMAEEYGAFLAERSGARFVSLRVFNMYGPGQPARFVIPHILGQALDPSLKEIAVQSLSPRRDYLYVDDVADACLSACSVREGFACYNVGSGVAHSVSALIAIIQEAAGSDKPVVERGAGRRSETDEIYADRGKIGRDLKWEPSTPLRAGIDKCIQLWTDRRENAF